MNNIHINHQKIASLLTRSAEQIDPQILAALSEARSRALQKQRIPEPVFILSAIGHRAHNLLPHSTHQWIGATILLATLIVGAIGYWQNGDTPLDMDILTDDLPIEVFLDQ
jgi:hypothetical protein